MADLHQSDICFHQEGIIRACGPQRIVVPVGCLAAVKGGRPHPLGGSRPVVPITESRSNVGGRCIELGYKRNHEQGMVACSM